MAWFQRARILELGVFLLILWVSAITFLPLSPFALINADHAVHQLMVRDFHWLMDLYYWGQNRLGSLEPMLAQLLRRQLGGDAALSLVHLVCALTGYLCFARWIKQPLVRLALATAWLMPAFILDFAALAHPYAAQMACVGLALWCVEAPVKFWKRFGAGLFLGLSLWMSDASIVCLLALWPLRKQLVLGRQWFWGGLGFSLPVGLIVVAKTFSSGVAHYGGVAKLSESWEYLQRVVQASVQVAQVNPLVPSVIGYVGAMIGLFIYLRLKGKGAQVAAQFPWIFRYGLYALGLNLGLVLVSKWVMMNSINGLPNRYFAPSYGWMIFLLALCVDRLGNIAPRSLRKPVLANSIAVGFFLLTLVGAVQTRLTVNGLIQVSDRGLAQSEAAVYRTPALIQAIRAVPTAGAVIGDYWTSYLWCSIDERFVCTPHQDHYVRQKRLLPQLKQQAVVYLVKERWLEDFPAEITQFDRRLRRIGPPQNIHTYTVAPYEWVPESELRRNRLQ